MTATPNLSAATGEHGTPQADRSALFDVLVGNLLAAGVGRWPGCDGLLVADVLDEYTRAAAAHLVPGEHALCERYPALAAQVVAFFSLHPAPGAHV